MKQEELQTNILDYWPISSPPRDIQLKAFAWLESEEVKNAKYLFLEAPVGSGKSLIGMTYSGYLTSSKGNSFILTPQRILQTQYENSFRNDLLFSLYGKSNYSCANHNTTCDIGSLLKPTCEACPQKIAKQKALVSPNVVLNYSLAMLHFAYLDHFKPRKLLVADECHVLESQLTEFDAIGITRPKAMKLGVKWQKHKDITSAHSWVVTQYLPRLEDAFADLEEICKPLVLKHNLTPDEIYLLRDLNKTEEHLAEVSELKFIQPNTLTSEYVLVHDNMSVKFKRLSAAKSFNTIMKPMAEKFLFMSSTILNHKGFCRDLGINPDEAAFLSLGSEFPIEHRPVFYMPTMKMNAQWKSDDNKANRAQYIQVIENLLDMHADDSGIIHTANFAIAEWLTEELNAKHHRIFQHNPESNLDRNRVINSFQDCQKPSLLISPSSTEGLDLKDDLARFAIFAKIPFGYLGDQWIHARMSLSMEWYQRQALIQLIQGCGRIVRSSTDWGNTYILDGSFGYLYNQTAHVLPKWWKDGYKVM